MSQVICAVKQKLKYNITVEEGQGNLACGFLFATVGTVATTCHIHSHWFHSDQK